MILSQILTPSIEKQSRPYFILLLTKWNFKPHGRNLRRYNDDFSIIVVKSSPVELGNKIGNYLVENVAEVSRFCGFWFLNIVISDEYYLNSFNRMKDDTKFGFVTPNPEDTAVMVEYSSPNTNTAAPRSCS
jgi:arginyl-tRNA synthetase